MRRAILVPLMACCWLCFLSGAAASPAAPVPKPYPPSFSMAFVTHVTTAYRRDDPGTSPLAGHLWYDWTHQRQRIDHATGSYECVRFYNHTDGPCSLVFDPNHGMYRLLYHHGSSRDEQDGEKQPALFSCCLDLPNVGTPPPDWAIQAKPSFDGVVYDTFSDRWAYQWTFDRPGTLPTSLSFASDTSASPYHTLRQEAWPSSTNSFAPLVFTFPSAGGRQDFHYQPASLVVGPISDETLFDLPDDCLDVTCASIGKEGGSVRNHSGNRAAAREQ